MAQEKCSDVKRDPMLIKAKDETKILALRP